MRRRPASSTPATNIMSSQSSSPPPLAGAVTVSEADVPAELPPAEAVESALAAIALAKLPAVALLTLMVMEQLPLAGILAPAMVTALAELVNVPDAPAQVVVGAGEVWMIRLAGTVSVKPDWVSANPFALLKVMVSVEAAFSPTLVGKNASVTVGATSVTVSGVGQAVAAVPAEGGAFTVAAPPALNETLALLSMCPAASVTVSSRVPALPVEATVTVGALLPD